jgi:hypothetical protein
VTCWNAEALFTQLKQFERACIAAGCAPKTVDSYVRYGQLFLDWRIGLSHTRGADGPRHPRAHCATAAELMDDVAGYRRELTSIPRQPGAVQTYVIHASQFVRWLDGKFEPCARLLGSRFRRATIAGTVRTVAAGAQRRASSAADVTWARESLVQNSIVAWLEAAGWTIERAADTASREHGEDVVARLGDRRLAIEVKGYPQAMYESGDKAGTPKRWHPAGQARTYFATAVHTALVMRDAEGGTETAIGLPDVPGYRGLLGQVQASLADLSVRIFLVGPGGSVRELVTKPS